MERQPCPRAPRAKGHGAPASPPVTTASTAAAPSSPSHTRTAGRTPHSAEYVSTPGRSSAHVLRPTSSTQPFTTLSSSAGTRPAGGTPPRGTQSTPVIHKSISGMMAMWLTRYSTGRARNQVGTKNSADISPSQAHTTPSSTTNPSASSHATAACTTAAATPRPTMRRRLTSPRGIGRSGRKRSSSASFTSSAARSCRNSPNVTTNAPR